MIPNFKSLIHSLLRFLCLTAFDPHHPDELACNQLDLFACKSAYSRDLGECLTANNELFDKYSLESRHKKLLGEQCKPVTIYVLGRHAGKQPGDGEIMLMVQGLHEMKALIEEGGLEPEVRDRYLDSQPAFSLKHSNLVTVSGARNHLALAQRLRAVYPEMFNASLADIKLATTSKLRTVVSGIEFLKAVDGYRLEMASDAPESCMARRSPKDYDSERALEDECLPSVLAGNAKIELEFHKGIKEQLKQELLNGKLSQRSNPFESPTSMKICGIKADLLKGIAKKLVGQLKLKSVPNEAVMSTIYDVCRYETSVLSDFRSIWCDLFERRDLEELEYIEDACVYHRLAPGRDSYLIQTSPLLKDILNTLRHSVTDSTSRLEAHFSFTHNGVFKKLLAVLGFFDPDKEVGYTVNELERFQQTRRLPKKRLWRSSLMLPFSANIVFALYKCDSDQFKMLTSLSERPVRVRGCSGAVCPLQDFFESYSKILELDEEEISREVRRMMGLGREPLTS